MNKIKRIFILSIFCLFTVMAVQAQMPERGKITVIDGRVGNGDNIRSSMNMITKVDIFDANGTKCVSRSNKELASGTNDLIVTYGGGRFEPVCTAANAKRIVVSWDFIGSSGPETWTYETGGNPSQECDIHMKILGPNNILSSAVGNCHALH